LKNSLHGKTKLLNDIYTVAVLRDEEVEIINKYPIIAAAIAVVTINIIAIPYQIYAQPSTQGNAITGINVGGHPYAIAVDPKTNIIYVAGILPKKIFTIDGSSNKQTNTIARLPSPQVNAYTKIFPNLAVSAATGLAFVAYSDSKDLHIIDASQGYVANDTLNDTLAGLSADPDPNSVYIYADVNSQNNNTIYKINSFYNSADSAAHLAHNDILGAIAVGPKKLSIEDKLVYVIGQKLNNVYILNSSTLKLDGTISIKNDKVQDPRLLNIAINQNTNKVYVTGYLSNSVYVINGYTKQLIKTIPVGLNPDGIAVNPNTNMIYVVNSAANTISVIDDTTETVVHTIQVRGDNPRGIAVNPNTNLIYVANALSGTVSVINGMTNNVMARISFNVNPSSGAGGIYCTNGQKILNSSDNTYDINTILKCEARPNTGFIFGAWSGDLASLISNSNNNPVVQFPVTRYGYITGIFIQQTPITIPPQFWTPLYGVIPGFFIPSIIGWLNNRRQRRYVSKHIDIIEHEHPELNKINKMIEKLYVQGKVNYYYYKYLMGKISQHYKTDANNYSPSSNTIDDDD
jgi:YVTN family beta-propeller protein